jgi:CheY-like chemotaxis protein
MRVLIAEDEPDICLTYKIALESRNHEVIISQDGNESLEIYKKEFLGSQHYNQNPNEHGDYAKSTINNNNNNSTKTMTLSGGSGGGATRQHIYSPFDVVVLDYRIPGKDGLQVAKEILKLNPEQRIIFASAYVRETLEDSVKELKRVVELMQKPFDADILVDTIEDKEAQEGVKILMRNLTHMDRTAENISDNDNDDQNDDQNDKSGHRDRDSYDDDERFEPSLEQIKDLFEGLRKIQKGRTF